MAKLNQLIAITNSRKKAVQETISDIYQKIQKEQLLNGLSRTYQPKNEDGDKLPSEYKNVKISVPQAIKDFKQVVTGLWDVVATQDKTNTVAKANIEVNGQVLAKDVPISHLLWLEKQLVDLHTFISKLPVLDPVEKWTFDSNSNSYKSDPVQTIKTKKEPKVVVKYEATKEHPAQTEMFHEDVIIGTYTLTKFSGAIPETQKQEWLDKTRQLQEAVHSAREAANIEATIDTKEAESLLNFVFNKTERQDEV